MRHRDPNVPALSATLLCLTLAAGCSSSDDDSGGDPVGSTPTVTTPTPGGDGAAEGPTTEVGEGTEDTGGAAPDAMPGTEEVVDSGTPAAPDGAPGPETGDGSGETSMPGPGTAPGASAPTEFDGDWQLACSLSDPEFPEEGYDVVTVSIAGSTASARLLFYTDSACTTPNDPAEAVLDASFAYPGGTTETARGTATHVDITNEGLTSDGVASPAFGADTDYEIILVDGDNLYFGDTETDPARDGESPENRPDTLEETPFVRQ